MKSRINKFVNTFSSNVMRCFFYPFKSHLLHFYICRCLSTRDKDTDIGGYDSGSIDSGEDTGDVDPNDVDNDGDGYSVNDGDCDDANPDVHPAATEICDEIDNDCDALIDEDDDSLDLSTATAYYLDIDGDGFGVTEDVVYACSQPDGHVIASGDCDDGNWPFIRELLKSVMVWRMIVI